MYCTVGTVLLVTSYSMYVTVLNVDRCMLWSVEYLWSCLFMDHLLCAGFLCVYAIDPLLIESPCALARTHGVAVTVTVTADGVTVSCITSTGDADIAKHLLHLQVLLPSVCHLPSGSNIHHATGASTV